MKPRFRNRVEAGQLLAAKLAGYAGRPNLLVLGLARGGVLVAHEVAKQLGAPLDVLVVRKLGVPCNEELAIGAIAPGGVCYLNDDIIELLDIESDAIGVVRLREEHELERREQLYRGDRPPLTVAGRPIIVVDDGVATGASMHAAVMFLHQHGATRVVVAAPVIARDAYRQLEAVTSEVVALAVPENLGSVGQWFAAFDAASDEDVRQCVGLRPVHPGSS
jgi:putative phosphoribosyl transferase